MSEIKKKIEKYIQADQIGKQEEAHDPESQDTGDSSVKIQINADSDRKASDTSDAAAKSSPMREDDGKTEDQGDSVQKELETARQEAKENHERYLRVYADFENFKKRTLRENEEFRRFANESLIKEILSVVDNLERAIESANSHAENHPPIVEGVQMTLKDILSILERFQVKPVDAVGKPFDPRYHQAFQQEESDEYPENTVLKEFQKGYLLHDRLLLPSMVIVSKKKDATGAEPD
jgi:molecular chaperone GrpE